MPKIIPNITQFFALMISIVFWAPSVYASSLDNITSQSMEEFVRERQIEGLNLNELDDKVYCGSKNTKCNRRTEICLRCDFISKGGVLTLGSQANSSQGKCFNKPANKNPETLNNAELHQIAGNWCQEVNTASAVGAVGRVVVGSSNIHLSYERNGFIAADSVRIGLFVRINLNRETFCSQTDGTCYRLIYDADNEASLAYNGKGATRGCEVLPIKINNMKNCFFCPLARVVFDSANAITKLSFENFSGPLKNVLVVAFAIWLVYTSLQLVFTFTKQNGSKYITGIIVQAGKFLFAYFLLFSISNYSEIFHYFISPILEAGINMADSIKAAGGLTSDYQTSSAGVEHMYFDSGNLYEKIEGFLAQVQSQLAAMQAIGSSLFCVGGHQLMVLNPLHILKNIGLGLEMMGLGLILFIFSLILTVSFAFYFIDALLQLAILGAMLPLMIAGWPFKMTAGYSQSGLQMLLNTFFNIFFVGFVISVELNLIDSAITEMNNLKMGDEANPNEMGLGGLFTAINSQDSEKLEKIVGIGAGGFLLLIFASIFGFKFVKEVPKLCDKLAGGANMGLATKVGTMGASAATGLAKTATKPAREMATDKYHEKGGLLGTTGRIMQVPARLAGSIKHSRLGQAVGNSAVGRVMENTRTSVQNFGASLGNKIKNFGDKQAAAGDANIHSDSLRGIAKGAPQRLLGKIAQKAGKGMTHAAEQGVFNAAGQKMEDWATKVHRNYRENEKRSERWENYKAHEEAHGRTPDRQKWDESENKPQPTDGED